MSIAKREALSNNCVRDERTGLTWARYTSAENAVMGTGGDGKVPWTGELYDIFQWCAAANTASLGGYADWRVPNVDDLGSLKNWEAATAAPDSTAFPSWNTTGRYWCSTTLPSVTTNAPSIGFGDGRTQGAAKTTAYFCALARGG